MSLEKIAKEIGIGTDTLRSMYRSFLDHTEKDLKKIAKASAKEDMEALRAHAHHIKGAAINLDLTELSERAKNLEYVAKNGEKDKISTLRDQLISEFRKQEQTIREML